MAGAFKFLGGLLDFCGGAFKFVERIDGLEIVNPFL
jgi:hypothetical protein